AMGLNAKGASVQVIDADAFKKLAEPTDEEVVALLKAGESETYAKVHGPSRYRFGSQSPSRTIHSEDFSGVKLNSVNLDDTIFHDCRFVRAELSHVHIGTASDCDFSKTTVDSNTFGDVRNCQFSGSTLNHSRFQGDFSGADFTSAVLDGAILGS